MDSVRLYEVYIVTINCNVYEEELMILLRSMTNKGIRAQQPLRMKRVQLIFEKKTKIIYNLDGIVIVKIIRLKWLL